MIVSAAIGLASVAVILWQEGIRNCFDGIRYTSCEPQPTPFNHRFHHWPAKVLAVCTFLSAVFLAATLGSWQAAALFATLPGVAFCVTNCTTVDLPALALAWGSALLWPTHPYASVAVSLASGVIHERGPVFAAVYAMSPWPLLGLLAVQWWNKPVAVHTIKNDSDRFVGRGTLGAFLLHRGQRDLLGVEGLLWSLRGVPVAAAWLGTSVAGWSALALSAASRLVSTDAGRCMIWCAPPMLSAMPEIPPWVVAAHVMTFRRMV